MRLRTKIVLTYIAVAVFGIALASFVSSWQLKNYLNRRTMAQVTAEVQTLADVVPGQAFWPDSTGSGDERLRRIAKTLDLRLTLIRKDGKVLFDSTIPRDSVATMENHAHRPEILRAQSGRVGTDRRLSASVNEEFVYAAMRIADERAGELDSGYVRGALNITEIETLDAQVQTIIWIVGLLTIGLITVVSLKLSTRISEPILRIASTAKAIKEGDVRQRVPVTSADEIGDLAKAINEMAEKLGNDITQLRKLERVRSEFLGNVSHELRTPIFSVQGFLETLLDGAVDDPSVNRDFLEKAHKHANRLNALLNDLIDISRIESGEMKMSYRYFPVLEFLQQIVDEMKSVAERKDLRLTLVPSVDESERVFGDRERLHQVMTNLFDNAVKYTDNGGSITCSVERDGPWCVIRVSDTGCGIGPEHQARIFERFYRVDKDRSRDVGGTGLGLAIVKHIVEAHGGTINVSSTVGTGSVFTVRLKR